MCLNADLRAMSGQPIQTNDSVIRALTDDACDECRLKAIHVELRRREGLARQACHEGMQRAMCGVLTAASCARVVWYCQHYADGCMEQGPACEFLHWAYQARVWREMAGIWRQTQQDRAEMEVQHG